MFYLTKLYNIIYTFTATSLFIFVYLVKEHICIDLPKFSDNLDFLASILIYILAILYFAGFCILLQRLNSNKDNLGSIKEIEYADNSFLANYLGFFFVALSLPKWGCFYDNIANIVIYAIIFLFTLFSHSAYYNPVFLILGFKFYNAKNQDDVKILLITKRNLKKLSDWNDVPLHRINNYTFIEV